MRKLSCMVFCFFLLVVCTSCCSNSRYCISDPADFFETHRNVFEQAVSIIDSKSNQIHTLLHKGSAVVPLYMSGWTSGNSTPKLFFSDKEWIDLQHCWHELEKYAGIEVDCFYYLGEYAIRFALVSNDLLSERLEFSYVYTPISDSYTVIDYICLEGEVSIPLQQDLWYMIRSK